MAVADKENVAELHRELAAAPDAKLAPVVAYLDGLPARDTAELFMQPLRPRLRGLSVRRRTGLGRLVVQPFEALVTDPTQSQPGAIGVPRPELRPMLASVFAALGERRPVLETALLQADEDPGALLAIGCKVWPAAARALATAEAPPNIPAADYARLIRMARAVLAGANTVENAARQGAPLEPAVLVRLMKAAAEHGPEGFGAQAAVIMARLRPGKAIGPAVADAAGGNAALRDAAQQALAALMAQSRQ